MPFAAQVMLLQIQLITDIAASSGNTLKVATKKRLQRLGWSGPDNFHDFFQKNFKLGAEKDGVYEHVINALNWRVESRETTRRRACRKTAHGTCTYGVDNACETLKLHGVRRRQGCLSDERSQSYALRSRRRWRREKKTAMPSNGSNSGATLQAACAAIRNGSITLPSYPECSTSTKMLPQSWYH